MNDILNRKFLIEYNEQSLIKTEWEYNSKAELDGATYYFYKYDDQGIVIEQKAISGESEDNSYKTISYFKKRLKVRMEYFAPHNDIPIEIRDFKYDQKDRGIQETISYEINSVSEINTTQYNSAGYISETSQFFPDNNFMQVNDFQYIEFDEQGNCTKLLIRENGQLDVLINMTYSYF